MQADSVQQEIQMQTSPSSRLQLKQSLRYMTFGFLILLSLFNAGTLYLFTTDRGHQLRTMLAGSILSSQHPQYARFLIPKSQLDELKSIIISPPIERSTLLTVSSPANKGPIKLDIHVETIETEHYTAKVMLVNDPTAVRLVSSQYKNKGEPLSDLIRNNNGVAGINAGGFQDDNGNGSGGEMIGIVICDSKVLHATNNDSYTKMLVGGFTDSGQFITGDYSVQELLDLRVSQAVSFGPQLIIDGKSAVTSAINSAYGWAPRTAIGQASDGTVIMVITDGRYYHNKTHRGASMEDLTEILTKYNVRNAMALDGGGSTTMIYDGQLAMQPATSTDAGMRYLPNAFIVGRP